MYVLRDVGLPIANCTFTFGDAVTPPAGVVPTADGGASAWDGSAIDASCSLTGGEPDGFGASCDDAADCRCKANYCALMPGQSQGVCTVRGCKAEPSICPSGYSCLDLSAFGPSLPSICTQG
jgi:hypothetical protein